MSENEHVNHPKSQIIDPKFPGIPMANFKAHIATSSLLGIGYGGAAYGFFDVPLSTCILAGGLCGVSGMVPDVDSNAGVPLRESTAFAAAVVPMMMIDRFGQFGLSPEWIVLARATVYLFIRFGLAALVRRWTVHRGMFHSLPAALVAGGLAFLLASGEDVWLRYYKAGGVVIGYLSHLLLDELCSIEWHRGRLRLKRSMGSCLKIFSHKLWPNVSTYLKLAVVTLMVLKEPGWMHDFRTQRRELGARRVVYGSDFGGRSFASQLAKVYGADVSPEARRLILAGNLQRMLKPILKAKGITL